jgi:hypothetical protein
LKQEIIMRSSAIVGVLVLLMLPFVLTAEDAEEDEGPSFWMKQKLKYSQEILNGLAQEDFALIEKNALAMKGLNKIESFVRQKPEGYRTQLKTFEFSVSELLRNSQDKSIDGATLAFTQMTISCVNCHKELRKQ